jgi:hypothetical protein
MLTYHLYQSLGNVRSIHLAYVTDVLREHFELDEAPLAKDDNITPPQPIQALRATSGRRGMVPVRWD